jgi:hypothetical protein
VAIAGRAASVSKPPPLAGKGPPAARDPEINFCTLDFDPHAASAFGLNPQGFFSGARVIINYRAQFCSFFVLVYVNHLGS